MKNDGFESIRKRIRAAQHPMDKSLPIICGPYPKCPVCGNEMIVIMPFRNERHLREYLKCVIPSCRKKLQFDDNGYAILEPKK